MKLILVARKLLPAYLTISALEHVHDVDGVPVADEGVVELAEGLGGALVLDADDDAVGLA
jgi:hypothetical protein